MMISNAVIDAPFRAHNPVACSQADATITGIAPLPSSVYGAVAACKQQHTVRERERERENMYEEEGERS